MAEVGPAEFVRRLATGGVIEGVRGPVSRRQDASAPRVAYLRELAPKLVSEFLAKSGGWRRRDVVVAGRPLRDQRIWSKDVWDRVDFKLSQPSWELMARAVEWRAGPGAGAGPLDPSIIDGLRPATMGDIVWFHLLLDPLVGAVMGREGATPPASGGTPGGEEADEDEDEDEDDEEAPRKRRKRRPGGRRSGTGPQPAGEDGGSRSAIDALLSASPLTALFWADAFRADYGDGDASSAAWEAAAVAARRRLEPLVRGDRAVVLTYLDDAVARAWLEAEPARRAAGVDEGRMRYASLASSITGLLAACGDSGRLDGMRPALRFYERYVVRVGRHAIATFFQERAAKLARPHVVRQSYTRNVALLFHAAGEIAAEAEAVEDTPSVDRTAAEKAFLKAFQGDGDLENRGLDDLADDYEQVRRVLSDEIG